MHNLYNVLKIIVHCIVYEKRELYNDHISYLICPSTTKPTKLISLKDTSARSTH
jgi:hypothetical protein